MPHQHMSPPARARSTRPKTHRTRSNSLPIVEALGCSTPEARLLLAEGSAARRRRTRSQRDRSTHSEKVTVFDPRNHLKFLNVAPSTNQFDRPRTPTPSESRHWHARIPSDITDNSTTTLVPESSEGQPFDQPIKSPLGNYSANLANFIKSQLRNIPTYTPGQKPTSPLSPRSCPDLSFRARSPPQSPDPAVKRAVEAPQIIEIPHLRPPMRSQFSAWSSTDDETDEDMFSVADGLHSRDAMVDREYHTSSVLGYYESSNVSTFLFPSTPMEEDEDDPQTAKATSFPSQSTRLGSPSEDDSPLLDTDSITSSLSRPQLASSSAPSYTSTASTLSYFDCKRPISVTPELRERIIAAVTPPIPHGKMFPAVSPWEGAALSNVHDVFVDSQQRVHVDGMTFDMQRDFVLPSGISTPC